MRTAIIGSGSLGTVIGALLTKSGKHVDLFDSATEQVEALNKYGATITGYLALNVPVNAFAAGQMAGRYDLVFLLTKRAANPIVLPQLLPYLHANSVVCTLQGGIPEAEVAAYAGRERTIGGAAGFGATLGKPGAAALTSSREVLQQFAFVLGATDDGLRSRLRRVKEYLDCVGQTELHANLAGIRWTKLLMDATFGGMSAALGCTYGTVLYNARAMICAAYIADECIKVARAQQIRLVKMQGADWGLFELESAADIQGKMALYKKLWGPHVRRKAGMLQDLEKGRCCEIDYINGVICGKVREYGVPTPFNDKIVELVHEAHAERSINIFDSLSRFDGLIEKYAKDVAVIV